MPMPIYKFTVQAFFLSLVISGLWLWEISLAVKLIVAGSLGMVVVLTQEELPNFFDNALGRLSGIEIRLRVIERSLELHRTEPGNTEQASAASNEDLESQIRVANLWEKVTPAALYDLLAIVMLFASSSGLAWLWIWLISHRPL